jgi:hypothetical protein
MSDDHALTGNYIDGSRSPAAALGPPAENLVPATSAEVRERLTSGMRQVDGLRALIVSGIAALVMTGGAFVLRRHNEDETDVAYHAIALIRKVLIRLRPAVADGSGDPSGTSAPRRRVGESRKRRYRMG